MEVFNIRNQKLDIDSATDSAESNEIDAVAFARLRAHNRKFERQDVNYPVRIRITDMNGLEVNQGTATICNMSPDGAFIGDLELDDGSVPLEQFSLHFSVESGDLKGVEGTCKPVRINAGEQRGFGVRFKKVFLKILGEDAEESEAGGSLS